MVTLEGEKEKSWMVTLVALPVLGGRGGGVGFPPLGLVAPPLPHEIQSPVNSRKPSKLKNDRMSGNLTTF
jgi:hypothetical protein